MRSSRSDQNSVATERLIRARASPIIQTGDPDDRGGLRNDEVLGAQEGGGFLHVLWRYKDQFHLLLELADGYQLGDVTTDDTFAHLSIFVQRLVREGETELLAWNPMQDEALYRVSADMVQTLEGLQQRMVIAPVASSGIQT